MTFSIDYEFDLRCERCGGELDIDTEEFEAKDGVATIRVVVLPCETCDETLRQEGRDERDDEVSGLEEERDNALARVEELEAELEESKSAAD